MSARRFLQAILSLAAAALLSAAISGVPETLVGTHFRYGTTNISFLADNLFEVKQRNVTIYDGFYTPRRNGDIWNVAATRRDGTITYLYTLDFRTSTSGVVNVTVAGRGTLSTNFTQTDGIENDAPATLTRMFVTNSFSAAGPSYYRIDFTGGSSGTFAIQRPGYGTGNFVYTRGMNTGQLVMTYSGDLAGDRDELELQFSPAPALSTYTGTQLISGNNEPISGVFAFE